ncbi:MAG: LLM class F420-dependent oxidoreductase [Actinomycetota bacterium]|nr:LLM class F420-dependent oxidoreductase [Actinomycetota bacterium]
MRLGLQIPSFTWPGGPEQIGPTLVRIARAADDAGYDSIWVMDHFFQIGGVGPVEEPMLEGYSALSFIAGHTSRARLGTLVTGVTYRHPGVLAKTVTTLDVLSGGRAWLGIGAAWFEREHRALGVPFPPAGERLGRMEEAIQICLQMWSEDDGPFRGRYYHLDETLCSPQPVSKPHPPVMIGGSGERRTLRLVARYADACNVFGDPDTARHKFDVLRRHCEAEGRDYDQIEKTVYFTVDVGEDGERASRVVDQLGALAEAGAQTAIGALRGVHHITPIEIVGRDVIPQAAGL